MTSILKHARVWMAGLSIICLIIIGVVVDSSASRKPIQRSISIKETLKNIQELGQEAEVFLAEGQTFKGKISKYSSQSITMERVSGQEYYDVVVATGAIVAVKWRARESLEEAPPTELPAKK